MEEDSKATEENNSLETRAEQGDANDIIKQQEIMVGWLLSFIFKEDQNIIGPRRGPRNNKRKSKEWKEY